MIRKLLIIIFILLLTTVPVVADEYSDAMKRAKTEDKPVVIYFYSKYCRFCDAMDRDVLFDKEIKKTLSEGIVYLRVDADITKQTARLYNVRGYPTTCLLDPTGKRIISIPGYIPKDDLKKVLEFLKGKHYQRTTLLEFLEK
ncbi:MAG: thioredoxin family protein [Proteobacteria bacterium]|nr:thioredoxin family protein [Pseudomonadota bacterium]